MFPVLQDPAIRPPIKVAQDHEPKPPVVKPVPKKPRLTIKITKEGKVMHTDKALTDEQLIQRAVERTIKPREQDLKMSLPLAKPNNPKNVPAIAPLFIAIDKNGVISINQGPAKEPLDADINKRDVPILRDRLKIYVAVTKAADQEPVVQIWAHGQAQQQRVVDVLNALAKVEIKKVTFTDLVEE